MTVAVIIAFHLVELTGVDKQPIEVNPMEVVSIRPVRKSEHFGASIQCIVHTSDGKFIAVVEDCDTVKTRLQEGSP